MCLHIYKYIYISIYLHIYVAYLYVYNIVNSEADELNGLEF